MHEALAYYFVLPYFSKTFKCICFLDNYLVTGFSVDLVMQFSDTEEAKINFPSSKFQNREHKIGRLFAEHIKKFEDPSGHEYKVKISMVTKNSWQATGESV